MDPRRKRIVINLDAASAAQPGARVKKRRWPKVLAILLLLVVAVVFLTGAGGFFWWQRYKTSPPYSLAMLVDASQKNDGATVDQYLDTEKVVAGLAGQVVEKVKARYGLSLLPIDTQRLDGVLPGLMPTVRQNIRQQLMQNIALVTEKFKGKPFAAIALTMPYVVKVSQDGDTAKVTVPDRSTELMMARNGERWEIVGMKDDQLAQNIVDGLVKDLPAIGQAPGELLQVLPRVKKRRR